MAAVVAASIVEMLAIRLRRYALLDILLFSDGVSLFVLVGAAGYELATSCSQSRRSTRLSYAPMAARMCAFVMAASSGRSTYIDGYSVA